MDNIDYPIYLYKTPGAHELPGGKSYDFAEAADDAQRAELHAAGWFDSIPEAIAGARINLGKTAEVPAETEPPVDEDAPPTREELEAKAAELGLRTKGVKDEKLAAAIEKKLG